MFKFISVEKSTLKSLGKEVILSENHNQISVARNPEQSNFRSC